MNSFELVEKELDSLIIKPTFTDLNTLREWFLALEIPQVEERFAFEDETYCRIPIIAKTKYDLLICCWKPGQESPMHGHPEQGCLVKILKGSTTEEVRYVNGSIEVRCNLPGKVAYINDSIGFHRVWNGTEQNAVSLHLYAPGGYKPQFKT